MEDHIFNQPFVDELRQIRIDFDRSTWFAHNAGSEKDRHTREYERVRGVERRWEHAKERRVEEKRIALNIQDELEFNTWFDARREQAQLDRFAKGTGEFRSFKRADKEYEDWLRK